MPTERRIVLKIQIVHCAGARRFLYTALFFTATWLISHVVFAVPRAAARYAGVTVPHDTPAFWTRSSVSCRRHWALFHVRTRSSAFASPPAHPSPPYNAAARTHITSLLIRPSSHRMRACSLARSPL